MVAYAMSRAYGLVIAGTEHDLSAFGNTARLLVMPCLRGVGLLASAYGCLCERELLRGMLERWDALMARPGGWREVKDGDIVPLLGIGAPPHAKSRIASVL